MPYDYVMLQHQIEALKLQNQKYYNLYQEALDRKKFVKKIKVHVGTEKGDDKSLDQQIGEIR